MCSSVIEGVPKQLDAGQNGKNRTRVPTTTKANKPSVSQIFLERSGARAINSDSLNPPHPDCPVCSPVVARVEIDPELATLEHLVHDVLQTELGYGEDLIVTIGDTLLYDQDFTDDLTKKLFDIGIKNDSFVTVKDENEPDTRLDLELVIMTR
jgi:ubiquitin-like 1-activating enzyme E1 B